MASAMMQRERRDAEQIREHYELEKELANKLRNSTREQRRALYGAVYDELFRRLRHHPQSVRKFDPEVRSKLVVSELRRLTHFLKPESTFLEIGAGDCQLSLAVARFVKRVYAVDISEEITSSTARRPENFRLVMSDGYSIAVPRGSAQIAYSNQLMEHLHPDDAVEQLRSIYAALAPGGKYICVTPSRLAGPHDVSCCFDDVATGFHLKEYTTRELDNLFKDAGFTETCMYLTTQWFIVLLPVRIAIVLERVLEMLPRPLQKRLAEGFPIGKFLGKIVGTKSERVERGTFVGETRSGLPWWTSLVSAPLPRAKSRAPVFIG
jgi:SAM-dependent methyltransferase